MSADRYPEVPADHVRLSRSPAPGVLVEHDLDLETAAALERGDAPVVLGRGRRYTAEQLAADKSALHDRLAAVEAERAEILWRHGVIEGDVG
jgi:hypothetical protein